MDDDYYEKVIDVFESDSNVVGVQGLDRALVENYATNIRNKFFGNILIAVENFLEQAFIIKDKNATLRPSLAVTHPIPDIDFLKKVNGFLHALEFLKKTYLRKLSFQNSLLNIHGMSMCFFHTTFIKCN